MGSIQRKIFAQLTWFSPEPFVLFQRPVLKLLPKLARPTGQVGETSSFNYYTSQDKSHDYSLATIYSHICHMCIIWQFLHITWLSHDYTWLSHDNHETHPILSHPSDTLLTADADELCTRRRRHEKQLGVAGNQHATWHQKMKPKKLQNNTLVCLKPCFFSHQI